MKRSVTTILTGIGIIAMQFSCSDNFLDDFSDADNVKSQYSEQFMKNQEQALSQYRQLLDSFEDVPLKSSSNKGKRERTEKVYPESYGGAYIDGDGTLVICVTDSNANARSFSHYVNDSNTRLKAAEYPLNTLKGVMDRMNAHIKEHPEGAIAKNIDFFAIDERANRIIVDVKQLDKGYEEQLRNLIADASCVVFQDKHGNLKNTATSLGSGAALLSWANPESFSLGFRAKLGSEEGFITTGHANWANEDYVNHNGTWFAKLVKYKNGGAVDAAFCEITNNNFNISSLAGGSVASGQLQGQVVAYGRYLNSANGTIVNVSVNAMGDDNGVYYENLTMFQLQSGYTIKLGDSGGGVFTNTSGNRGVLGVITGYVSGNASLGMYSKASEIRDEFGIEIY